MSVGQRWLLRARVDGAEWLDQDMGAPEAVEQSLADLNRINRWLGGMDALTRHLYPRLREWHTDRIRILDIGAGGCAVAVTIAQWARAQHIPVQVFALDRSHAHLCWSQRAVENFPEIVLVQGDALTLPFPDGQMDFVISSLFLHHFAETELGQLLQAWGRAARRSIVMSDLVRHPIPYWFMKLASPVFARSEITRHDAAVSIRRGYRPFELYSIAVAAGWTQAQVFTHFPYRMTLVIDHGGMEVS